MEHLNQSRVYIVPGLKPVNTLHSYAYSVTGGAGGRGTKISTTNYTSAAAGNLGGWNDFPSTTRRSEILGIWNGKQAMQELNDRLAHYVEQVKMLDEKNRWLEVSIREATEKRGPLAGKDYNKYYAVIEDLKAKKLDMRRAIAQLTLAFENARLSGEDFKFKMDYELSMRQMVEADVAKLRQNVDDTNIACLNLETDVEFLKEDLICLKKDHENEVAELRDKVTKAGVHVDVDAPKGQDISRVIEEMRNTYERLIQQKKDEIKAWHESKVEKVQVQVTENTTALKEATGLLSGTKRTLQDMEIKLQTARTRNETLDNARHEINQRYGRKLDEYKRISEKLEAEKNEIEKKRGTCKITTEKLQEEINEYRRLLEGLDGGGTLRLEDAVDSRMVLTKKMTLTQTLVNGKVVSETQDVTSSEAVVPKK
ncbi:keratin, type I cytoskeletal 18-like [Betta splendens]|uniref:Keratin, type I cytoskeletal 18-like n=1 Tax=Betta splendens TaxID=158456 RepID=A0A6P7N030_BETSP|nr:keratin, type I cytoskeletal 18-like [Betta splendens]